jgi:NAD(P)-dependent dehydrogenase (short-subunit alcohol dehydrogenase family)
LSEQLPPELRSAISIRANDAGIIGPTADIPLDGWHRVMEFDLSAVFNA